MRGTWTQGRAPGPGCSRGLGVLGSRGVAGDVACPPAFSTEGGLSPLGPRGPDPCPVLCGATHPRADRLFQTSHSASPLLHSFTQGTPRPSHALPPAPGLWQPFKTPLVCVCVCACAHAQVCLHTCAHTCLCIARTQLCVFVCACTHLCVFLCTCVCLCCVCGWVCIVCAGGCTCVCASYETLRCNLGSQKDLGGCRAWVLCSLWGHVSKSHGSGLRVLSSSSVGWASRSP